MQRQPTGAGAAREAPGVPPAPCGGGRGRGRGGSGDGRRRGVGIGGRRGPGLTWLSSFSAAIRSFGSMVPFSAWMIRLRSISPGEGRGGSAAPGPVGRTATFVLLWTPRLPPA